MDAELDGTIKDSIVAADGELMDVDVQLVANHFAHVQKHALAVDALDFDGGIEELLLVHVPLGVYDAVAVAGFQLGCHWAGALVNLDAILVVDEAHNIVARDGVTTVGEYKLVDILLGEDKRFLLVEIFAYDEEF